MQAPRSGAKRNFPLHATFVRLVAAVARWILELPHQPEVDFSASVTAGGQILAPFRGAGSNLEFGLLVGFLGAKYGVHTSTRRA